jgi:hypothetical protein
MGSFYMNEAMFDLPDAGFVDRTVTYLARESPGGAPTILLFERRPLPSGETLRQLVAGHGSDAAKRLLGYSVIFEREVEIGSHPAIDVGVRWRTDAGDPIYTRRVHMILEPSWFMIVGEAPHAERERCDAYVDHVTASLRVRD